MDKLILEWIEREIIYRLCNDRLYKTDAEWADISKSADKLIDSTVPISRYSDGNLHDCIAYASYELSITTGEKAKLDNREHHATMYHAFWFCVAELARRRMSGH